MKLFTIGILIESTNENDLDNFYELLIEELDFKECNDDKPLPFTMLIKESESSINVVYDQVIELIEQQNLDITNFYLFDIKESIHETKDNCE